MGQHLSEPNVAKTTERLDSSALKVGVSCMQGWRTTMEDAHIVLLSVPDDPEATYLAVFDGHGGNKIARYACDHLLSFIIKQDEYALGEIAIAIQKGFMEFDRTLKYHPQFKYLLEGTTAVIVLIKGGNVYCGNAGDSRAIACIKDELVALSNDHKPTVKNEERRIIAAGGWIASKRVNGNLSLSRAFGDFVFKYNTRKSDEQQIITAMPDVTVHPLTSDWDFIVLACDGIWDVMKSQEVIEFVKTRLSRAMEPEMICEDMLSNCLTTDINMCAAGCDNMTAIVAVFNRDKKHQSGQETLEEGTKEVV